MSDLPPYSPATDPAGSRDSSISLRAALILLLIASLLMGAAWLLHRAGII